MTQTVQQMTPAERLKRSRIASGYASAAAAAAAFGWDEYVYRSHESGRRAFDLDWAERYGRAFQTPPEWIYFGRGVARLARLYVSSYVGAGAEIFPIDGPLDEVDPPPGCSLDAFAVIVRGDSMVPVYADGDLLVAEWVADPRELVRKRAIIDLENGARLVKQITPGATRDTFTLISHNAEPILNARIAKAARILWHKQN